MLDPVTVLLIVSTQDASDPALPAVRAALIEAARGEASVVIEQRDALPSDDEAVTIANASHAEVVTELRWQGADRERVWMHVHVGRSPTWFDREITFRRTDAAAERGRAIGVVLAAMLPEIASARDAPAQPVGSTPPATTTPSAPAPAQEPQSHAATVPASSAPAAEPVPPARAVAAIGATGFGSIGLGGPAPDGGGALDARWLVASRFALRGVGEARFGSVSAARATAQTWAFGAGASLRIAGGPQTRADLALRSDLLASYLQLAHTAASSGASKRQARWLPAIDFAIEASWHLAPAFALTIALGAEATLGTTDIVVDGGVAAHVAPIRGLGEIGIRLLF